jgi:hypothetical protein
MPAWLDAIISPLNAAGEGIQKLIEVRDLAKFGDALGKLYAQVLSAQQGALGAQAREAALSEEIRALKKQIAELEAWETEKERYELVALAPNVMAYSIRADSRGAEPSHLICANCYQVGRKSFLNQHTQGSRLDGYRCRNCGEDLRIHKGSDGPRSALPPSRGGGPDGWMRR